MNYKEQIEKENYKELTNVGINIENLSLLFDDSEGKSFNIMNNKEVIGYGTFNEFTNWAHCNLTLNRDFCRGLNDEAEAEYLLETLIEQNKVKLFVL